MMMGSFGTKVAGLSVAALLGLGVAACGEDNPSGSGGSGSSSTSASSGGGGMGGAGGAGMGGSGGTGGMADVCAAQNSLCFDLNVPADLMGTPKSLAVVGYKMLPPMAPDAIFQFGGPVTDIKPGATVPVKIADVTQMGQFYVVAVLFMEGGGVMAPKPGVDYQGMSAMPVDFTGAPATTDPITLMITP